MKKIICTLALLIMISPAPAEGQQFEVMVYTSPDRWHDPTIPTAMTEFRKMADQHDFALTWAQQAGSGSITDPFSESVLQRMDVVVFLHSRAYELNEEQRENFKNYIHNGGGFVGIHAASAIPDQELWFQQLIGRVFTNHPEEQTAVYHVINKNHPATMHLPDRWIYTGELYSFNEELTDNLNYLITVDENTYDPSRTWGDDRETAMGDFHPISWYQEFEGGRSFYTSLGHIPESFEDPWFLAHIYGGIYWAATGLGLYE
jgi:type 1 glutamine amidotransferase